MTAPQIDLRIWKHSHGGRSSQERDKEREKLRKRSVITLFEDTAKEQGLAFREQMRPGDFLYLCHGNRVQLFGQITSNFRKASKKRWVEREYRVVKDCSSKASRFSGPQKKWTPNFNSTCALVPLGDLSQFERNILVPFFRLRLRDLKMQISEESILPEEEDSLASLSKKKYEEARQRLVLHKRFETVRNRKLVQEAKKYFIAKHGKLFCEGCGFDFQLKYGVRGRNFIEAHHSIPIKRIAPGTLLKVTDLRMVCANCHRMLHIRPWITVRKLIKTLRTYAQGRSLQIS